jgi:hypothetical protein
VPARFSNRMQNLCQRAQRGTRTPETSMKMENAGGFVSGSRLTRITQRTKLVRRYLESGQDGPDRCNTVLGPIWRTPTGLSRCLSTPPRIRGNRKISAPSGIGLRPAIQEDLFVDGDRHALIDSALHTRATLDELSQQLPDGGGFYRNRGRAVASDIVGGILPPACADRRRCKYRLLASLFPAFGSTKA